MELEKALCFVLDPNTGGEPPSKKRKKKAVQKDPKMSALTFGSKLDLAKLVQCKAFDVAWRLRPGQLVCKANS